MMSGPLHMPRADKHLTLTQVQCSRCHEPDVDTCAAEICIRSFIIQDLTRLHRETITNFTVQQSSQTYVMQPNGEERERWRYT